MLETTSIILGLSWLMCGTFGAAAQVYFLRKIGVKLDFVDIGAILLLCLVIGPFSLREQI